jgi:biopolymer transport protein ExbD
MQFYTRKKRMPTVIIVSLIDILAILLIFVIVTTTFKREQPEVVIRLPESSTAAGGAAQADPAVLAIAKDSQIFLDAVPVKIEGLRVALETMKARDPARPLAMSADTDAPFGTVVRVLDALKEAGVKNVPALTEGKTAP